MPIFDTANAETVEVIPDPEAVPIAESLPSQGLTTETDAVKLAKLTNKELVKKYRQLVPSLPDRKIQKPDSASKQTLIDEILRLSALDT
ncbi:MAG: hypothetical protein ACK456_00800 [Pseudanabaenaceae cyanobacterium]